ncbi:hypothetical protein TELCIR_18413 [Teladorsagia circumcincta]|uniref:Uncharacterized protein n=1 Tax=Teladorsagia circumcincta TaxID=45464 RepID=A0A2G9TQ83_TELCI|nr:hypothetical protein TELCIR_18413 [Teladorsagia circumcincta]
MLTRCYAVVSLLLVHCVHTKGESSSEDTKEEKQVPQFFTVEGVVGPGNFTRYELKFAYPMRIVLQTLEGDADIYFSYTDKSVSYELHTHDASSATCGLDYIDILSNPRPSYLGVYGHPSKDESSYRLLVMVAPDGNFEGPELINQWGDLVDRDKDGKSGHPIYIDILSGILEILVEILL